MVALAPFLAIGCAFLSTVVHAFPRAATGDLVVARADSSPCGTEPVAGIRKPANGSTITISKETQENYDGTTFEIIYCSSAYFKTASLNTSTWLATPSDHGSAADMGNYAAEALALGTEPSGSAASPGFYGYRYNVTLYPEDGNYPSGLRTLTVYEVQSGYYNAINIETHSVAVNFKKEPTS